MAREHKTSKDTQPSQVLSWCTAKVRVWGGGPHCNADRNKPATRGEAVHRSTVVRRSYLAPFVIIILLLTITSCTGGGAKTFERYKGTDGLTIAFLQNAPPETLYEDRPFPVRFNLANKGASNVSYDDIIVTFGTNPLYLKENAGINPFFPKRFDDTSAGITGKAEGYPQGETKLFSIPTEYSFATKPVFGQREEPQTELSVNACFVYHTFSSMEVCIDTNIYDQNERKQVCKQADITLAGGQGAPIAVTQVEVTALPVIAEIAGERVERIQPQFIIHLKNVGTGYLIGPDTLELASACVLKNIPKEQINTVRINANLLRTKLLCGAGSGTNGKTADAYVKLENGEGEIICTVGNDELSDPIYSSPQNFQTILSINVSYIYKVSAAKTLTIQRVPGTKQPLPTGTELGQVPGYSYDAGGTLRKDAEGRPITQCEYAQEHAAEAPKVMQQRIKDVEQLGQSFSCSCGLERCLTLARNSNSCFTGLCPGDTYCCTDVPKPKVETAPSVDTTGQPLTASGTTSTTTNSGTPGKLETWRDVIVSAGCSAGVYPSIIAAQFQLESQAASKMPKGANNPFGVHCSDSMAKEAGKCVYATDNGKLVPFRVYTSIDDAIRTQPLILTGKSYGLSSVITGPFSAAVGKKDFAASVNALKPYAESSVYVSSVNNIINQRGLRTWDACIK